VVKNQPTFFPPRTQGSFPTRLNWLEAWIRLQNYMYVRPSCCKHIQPCKTLRLLMQRDKIRLPLSFAWSTSKVIPLDQMLTWVLTNGNGQRNGRTFTASRCTMSTKGVCKLNGTCVFFFFFRWRYSPLWSLACRKILLNFSLSITNTFHLLTPSTWRSLSTSSLHPFLGLPLRLVPSSS
jgi:hypothetical protein